MKIPRKEVDTSHCSPPSASVPTHQHIIVTQTKYDFDFLNIDHINFSSPKIIICICFLKFPKFSF